MARWLLVVWMCFAGPAWAGEVSLAENQEVLEVLEAPQAWVADYRLRDAQGERALTVVRSATRVEYRMSGEPVRVWQQLGDGVEHREIFAADQRVVLHAPGDLRALGQLKGFEELAGLVDPALRAQLRARGRTRVAGQQAQRLRGTLGGVRLDLDWLPEAAMPARYRRQTAHGFSELTLHRLDRVPASDAFTSTDGYRELDYADLGDMERDPFARQFIHQGF